MHTLDAAGFATAVSSNASVPIAFAAKVRNPEHDSMAINRHHETP
jgi:hypothetical protein